MVSITLIGCLLCLFLCPIAAQLSYEDSLQRVLLTAPPDTHRVFLLNELAWEKKFTQADTARQLLTRATQLATQLHYLRGLGDAYNFRGVVEDIHRQADSALYYFEKALDIRHKIGDQKGVAAIYNNLGNVNESKGDYLAALKNYQKSRQVRLTMGDTTLALRNLYNISLVHENMGNYLEALNAVLNYLQGLGETGDPTDRAYAYNSIGNIKAETDRFSEALENYEKAKQLHQAAGNDWELAGVHLNIGSVKDALGDQADSSYLVAKSYFSDAIKDYETALRMSRELEDVEGEAQVYNNMASTYKNLGSLYQKNAEPASAQAAWKRALDFLAQAEAIYLQYDNRKGMLEVLNTRGDVKRRQKAYREAVTIAQQSLQIARAIDDQKFIQNAYKDLARAHYALADYQTAYDWRKKYDELRYRRINIERVKNQERREALYGDQMKQLQIDRQQQQIQLRESQLNQARLLRNALIGGAVALAMLVFLLYNRYRFRTKTNRHLSEKNRIIEAERQRSETLLLNILPAATAQELKQYGKAQARKYDSVTVLFTDFKDFTKFAEQLHPEALVQELDTCFQTFDEIVSRHGVEKIKTIGDAYMCAGGLPITNTTHPVDVVNAALEIRDFMRDYNQQLRHANRPELPIRLGIHTGEVVAGVVGSRKFAYDIWGDTVNIAARMESSGVVGQVNISETTWQLIQHDFPTQYRGRINAKNKEKLSMYLVG